MQLITLGRLELHNAEQPDEPLVGLKPRQLALLAFLATDDNGRFHRRDLVTAMFWPESEIERARHALRQTIYGLRQVAGDGVIINRGQEEVGIGPGTLACDALEFVALSDAGKHEEALALYQGDFLAGMHPAGTGEVFEEWLTSTRTELRGRAITDATALAQQAEAQGRFIDAARWCRRAIEVDPVREGSTRDLMRVLLASGDRAAARDALEALSTRLRRDFGIEPTVETRALLDVPTAPIAQPDPVRRGWRAGLVVATAVLLLGAVLVPRYLREAEPSIATRLYDEGLRAYHRGDAATSLRLFQQVLDEDSTFAMAAYYGDQAARLLGDGLTMQAMQQLMATLAPTRPDRERLLLETIGALAKVDPRAIDLADTLVERWPDDAGANLLRAQAYGAFGQNQALALASVRRAIALESVNPLSTELPCRLCDAYLQLVGLQLLENDFAGAEKSARELIARQPHRALGHSVLSGVLARLDRSTESAVHIAMADSINGKYSGAPIEDRLRTGTYALADPELERWMQSSLPATRDNGRWWLTISLRNQGRMAEALQLQQQGITPAGQRLGKQLGTDSLLLAQLLCESGSPMEGAAIFRSLARVNGSGNRYHQARQAGWTLTHAATCLSIAGDTTQLTALADTIQRFATTTGSTRHAALPHYVRGLLLRARGDTTGALLAFQHALTAPVEGLTRINFELAGVLISQGRAADAIVPLQAGLRGPLQAGGLYLPRPAMEERLAQAFALAGQPDSARAHRATSKQVSTR